MPDKSRSVNRGLLIAGIGVFLLVVETAVIFGWRVFRDGDRLTVMLTPSFDGAGLFQHLIWRQIPKPLKQVQGRDDDKGNQSLNTISGQESTTRFDAEHYPIMVMIDNSPEARVSHYGLSSAAIVYETLVEGGATRLAALFAGPPSLDRLGPVRSARPVFVDIASGWGAFYWHAGGSPEALAQIKNSPITDLNEISGLGTRYFWRDRTIARPHNLFSDAEKIKLGLMDFAPKFQESANIWQYGDVPDQASSSPAATISIDFSQGILFDVGYTYDSDKKNYARIMSNRPHVDRETSEQIAVDNIIVQRVGAEGYYASGYGRLIINTIGEGKALFFRDGRAFSGRWRKPDRSAQTEWLDEFGAQFILKPGTVLVEILPGKREVNYN